MSATSLFSWKTKRLTAEANTVVAVVVAVVAAAAEDPNYHFSHWNKETVLAESHDRNLVSCAEEIASIV